MIQEFLLNVLNKESLVLNIQLCILCDIKWHQFFHVCYQFFIHEIVLKRLLAFHLFFIKKCFSFRILRLYALLQWTGSDTADFFLSWKLNLGVDLIDVTVNVPKYLILNLLHQTVWKPFHLTRSLDSFGYWSTGLDFLFSLSRWLLRFLYGVMSGGALELMMPRVLERLVLE